jgi:hypothetical protein
LAACPVLDCTLSNITEGSVQLYANMEQKIYITGQHFDDFQTQGQLAFTKKSHVDESCGHFLDSDIFNVTDPSTIQIIVICFYHTL